MNTVFADETFVVPINERPTPAELFGTTGANPDDIIYEDKVKDNEQLRLARGNGQPTKGDGVQLEAGKVYLMDVHGNIFMRYEPVANEQEAVMRSKGLRDDVRRAIKATGL